MDIFHKARLGLLFFCILLTSFSTTYGQDEYTDEIPQDEVYEGEEYLNEPDNGFDSPESPGQDQEYTDSENFQEGAAVQLPASAEDFQGEPPPPVEPPQEEYYEDEYEEEFTDQNIPEESAPGYAPPPEEDPRNYEEPAVEQTQGGGEVFGHENSQDLPPETVERGNNEQVEYVEEEVQEVERAVREEPLEQAEAKVEKLEENLEGKVDPVEATEKLGQAEDDAYNEAFKQLQSELGDDLMDDKSYSNLLKIAIAPYKGKTEPEIRDLLIERYQDTFFGKMLIKYPKIMNFITATIADPVALPRLGKIIDERNKFYRYIWVNLGVFLMSYIMRRVFLKNKSFGQKIRIHIVIFSIMTFVRISIFLFFFNFEVERVFEIFSNIFFG